MISFWGSNKDLTYAFFGGRWLEDSRYGIFALDMNEVFNHIGIRVGSILYWGRNIIIGYFLFGCNMLNNLSAGIFGISFNSAIDNHGITVGSFLYTGETIHVLRIRSLVMVYYPVYLQ